jgi:hypothetical protein
MGLTQRQIGQQLGLSQQLVCYDLRRIRDRYLKAQLVERRAKVIEILETLRDIRRESFEAWELSRTRGKPDTTCLMRALDTVRQEIALLGLSEAAKLHVLQAVVPWDKLMASIAVKPIDAVERAISAALENQPSPRDGE